jgi:hypothetical protein
MRRGTATFVAAATAAGLSGLALPASAATGYQVTVTCSVPRLQPERQLAPNSCLNYLPDGTQTFTARVRNSSGSAVRGAVVTWTDSNSTDAFFRPAQNPCVTNSAGLCSAELVDRHPKAGEQITVTATALGASGRGYLTFSRR